MNFSIKSKIVLIYVFLLMQLVLSSIIIINYQLPIILKENLLKITESNKKALKNSNYWEVSNIIIDGNDDWSLLAASNPWCNGSGTLNDPYIIYNISINGRNSGSCILIQNSNVYSIIKNCNFFNGGPSIKDAGISMINVVNSQLIDNNVSYNTHGIRLDNVSNCIVSDNIINYNKECGIFLWRGDHNLFSGNIANNNGDVGINIFIFTRDNIITKNIVNNNYFGISLGRSNNIASNNTVINNEYYGIVSNGINKIRGNIINDSFIGIKLFSYPNNLTRNLMKDCGIHILHDLEVALTHYIDISNLINRKPIYYYTNEINLKANDFTSAGQVILVNCSMSSISNLDISNCFDGISLLFCNNITISNNSVAENFIGIDLWRCNKCNIKENIVLKNHDGIEIWGGESNDILRNTIKSNTCDGIMITSINKSTIIENKITYNKFDGINILTIEDSALLRNNVSYNGNHGINIIFGGYLEIIENAVNNNNNGFDLGKVDYSRIMRNTVNYNRNNGFYLKNCDYNTFKNNIATKNYCGINLTQNSDYNTINDNILIDNVYCYSEDDSCVGNTFINNNCGEFNALLIGIIANIILFLVMTFLYLNLNRKKDDSKLNKLER